MREAIKEKAVRDLPELMPGLPLPLRQIVAMTEAGVSMGLAVTDEEPDTYELRELCAAF